MSEDGSPSLLLLKGYRIQRKPIFSHTPNSNESSAIDTSSDCSPIIAPHKLSKIRILEDSDLVDVDISQNMSLSLENCTDQDAELSRSDKVVVIRNPVSTSSTNGTTNLNNSMSPESGSVTSNGNDRSLIKSPGYVFFNRPKKSEAVIEKERQMKFLREKFPGMESMAVHDVLSKHKFQIDEAVKELELKQKDKTEGVTSVDYEKWKETQEEVPAETKIIVQQNFNAAHLNKKRKLIGDFSQATKHKAKRLRTEAVSDESDNEDTRDYRDNRVYNSDDDSDTEVSNVLTKDKKKVFEFFQTATANELQLMNWCSKKKAELIIESRPFNDWIDLVTKLQSNKNLQTELLNSAQEVLKTRHNVQNLMKKCKNLAVQMEHAVAAGAGVKTQPSLLNSSKQLTNYQMVGLNWLAVLHAQGVNGILADEMGLGKTIQVIAFLAHLKEIGGNKDFPHLVVVPSSTLDNWRVEFERWCPTLNVFTYYGTTEERKMFRIEHWSKGKLSSHDVILTTYSMVCNTPEERKMFKVTQMHYVIFDEAHMLKNMNTQRYENLIRIKALNRILLTGTPLQNNLLELMSLLIFVMPAMFAGKSDDLKSLFQKNSKKQKDQQDLPAFEKHQINQAKDIMKPFVLRRLKCDVLQDLPRKTDELIQVQMPPTQAEQYQNLVHYFQNVGKDGEEAGSCNAMTMMSDLRKLSNHPLLLRYHYQEEDLAQMAKVLASDPTYKEKVVQYIHDDLSYMSDFEIHSLCKQYKRLEKLLLPDNLILTSGKFMYLDKKLQELKSNGHRVLIFSQYVIMLNVMEEYLQIRQHHYLRLDGNTPVTTRQELIDQFTNDSEIFIFLLSTRAGGLGINLTAADTVIIHDIDFNPYNDKQAEDRCHRMGQTKPVQVFRLISQGTLEEGMWQMNQEKLKLEKEVTAEENENPDVKSVVRLLSSVLGMETAKVTNIVTTELTSPSKTKS